MQLAASGAEVTPRAAARGERGAGSHQGHTPVCDQTTNRAYLQRGGDHYIVCEKLRSASADAQAALARPGRYHLVQDNLSVKQVRVGDGARAQRFCVCVNPEAKSRDQIVRANLVAYLAQRIDGSDAWPQQRRDELVGQLRQTPGLARFLRRTKDHKLRLDKTAIAKDAHFATASG